MNLTHCPIRFVTCFFIAMILTTCWTESNGDEPPQPRPATEESIVALLQKRRSVLSQLVKHQTAAYRKGEADIEAVVQAHQHLLLVELELATGHEERITLLERSVELATDLEKIAEAKHKAGQGSVADLLRSQSDRLKVQIDLVRERQKERKR